VSITRLLDAPPSRVHRAVSDPEELTTWFSRGVEGSLAVGTRSILTWHDRRIPVDVLESDPPTRFRFRWHWLPDDRYATEVTVELAPYGYGTRLTLRDGPFDLAVEGVLDAYAEALEGWGDALTNLRSVVDYSNDLRRLRR
jgi:uncharacterized protein YndB with AHSA1/START domain